MVPVARRNLLSEKGRFAISVIGVAFAMILILTIVALYRGLSRSGEIFQQLPGQLWVVQQGTSDPFHSISLLEPQDVEVASRPEGVKAVVPVLSRQMKFSYRGRDQSVRLMALDFGGLPVSPELRERFLPQRGEIAIDEVLARKAGLRIGDSLTIGGVPLTVSNVRPKGGDVFFQFAFLNFADAQEIFGVGGIVTYGMVVLEEGAEPERVAAAISEGHPGLQVYTAQEFAQSVRREIGGAFVPIILVLVIIGFVVGTAVVGLTIYTATIERTREFAVMKAVGAGAAFLYRIVLAQATVLTAAGFLLGLAGALGVSRLAEGAVPEFATEFRVWDIAAALLATGGMAVLASFVPIRRINSIDPAMVFRA